MKPNTLTLTGIKQKVRIGCTVEERGWPQFLTMDIGLTLNMDRCIATDDLNDTVDYIAVLDIVRTLCEGREWKLIEKMCADISNELLESCPMLSSVTVSAIKNISEAADGVRCEVTVKR